MQAAGRPSDPELEEGEVPVRGPYGKLVPASVEGAKIRRESKKAKKIQKKQRAIERSKATQQELEAEKLRTQGLSHLLLDISADNLELCGHLRHLQNQALPEAQELPLRNFTSTSSVTLDTNTQPAAKRGKLSHPPE